MSMSVFEEGMPTQVTQEIERFCDEVAPGQRPVYVPVKPQAGALESRCHSNVEEYVEANGGTPIYGWIIWQSSVLLHAEFHCNWLSPAGELSDITPKADGETTILFLPDPTTRWKGRCVPSRRKARRTDPLLSRFVTAQEKLDTIRTKYRPGQAISSFDNIRILALMFECQRLQLTISRFGKLDQGQQGSSIAERRAENRGNRKRRTNQRRRRR